MMRGAIVLPLNAINRLLLRTITSNCSHFVSNASRLFGHLNIYWMSWEFDGSLPQAVMGR